MYSNLNITVRTGQKLYMHFKGQKPSKYIVVTIPGRNLSLLVNDAGGAWHTPKSVKTHMNHPLSVLLGERPTRQITFVHDQFINNHWYKVYKTNVGLKTPDPVTIYIRDDK